LWAVCADGVCSLYGFGSGVRQLNSEVWIEVEGEVLMIAPESFEILVFLRYAELRDRHLVDSATSHYSSTLIIDYESPEGRYL
jgi:hypothetical protein